MSVKAPKPIQALPRKDLEWMARGERDARAGRMTNDALRNRAFWIKEWRKCTQPGPEGFTYWAENYGYVETTDGIQPIGQLWKGQAEKMLPAYWSDRRNIFGPKSRQWGFTTFDCLDTVHACGVRPGLNGFKAGAFSLGQREADAYLETCRIIAQNQPLYFKEQGLAIGDRLSKELKDKAVTDVKYTMSYFNFPLRGSSIRSLPARAAAGRSFRFNKVTFDEYAYHPDPEAGFAAVHATTLLRDGKIVFISTGNGQTGSGQEFYRRCMKAYEEDSGELVFLPAHEHEVYGHKLEEIADEYASHRLFLQEYPRTLADCFQGYSEESAYDFDHIDAARSKGQEWDQLRAAGKMPPPMDSLVELGIDWGNNSHCVLLWHLPGGNIYVLAEYDKPYGYSDAQDWSQEIVEKAAAEAHPYLPKVCWYDAAGKFAQDSFVKTWGHAIQSVATPFGAPTGKGQKGLSRKELNAEFLRTLLRRTDKNEANGIIGISPNCPKLLSQLRAIEITNDGKIKKGNEKNPDHAHDSLIAALTGACDRW